MAHVLAFRHAPFEGAGRLASVLDEQGFTVEYADLYRNRAELPDVTGAAGLVFLGGPMSVNDPLPYLEWEMGVIRAARPMGQPVLGICLGAQLIAKALGARVYRNPVKEIGWFDIRLTAEGAGDRLLGSANPVETVFHWHGETFELPMDAVVLASSEGCAHQAIRFSETMYGLQFHPEVTPEMIRDWCRQDENCGDVRELEGPIDAEAHADRMTSLAHRLFGSWCRFLIDFKQR